MTDDARAAFAQVMGMKRREILAVEEVPGGGWVVTTHDHQRTMVDAQGRVVGAAPPVPITAVPPAAAPARPAPAGDLAPVSDPAPDPGLGAAAEPVPDGSEREVLAWVDGDPERAAAALRAEEARETPRKGLLGKLQQLVG